MLSRWSAQQQRRKRAEQALTVLGAAADKIWKIGLLAKGEPTQEDMLLLSYSCKVDLMDAHKMLMAADALMGLVREQTGEAAEGIRAMGGGVRSKAS